MITDAISESAQERRSDRPQGKLVALLGPTNTGKTHHALERMLEFPTGMIGLPLRLLAREVYERLSGQVGERAVALITGEEKRLHRSARYLVCTVEAMPMDRRVDFLALDEVQLAAHPERGHVFTERLLFARGRRETWLLGTDTMAPLLRRIAPSVEVEGRARLSTLRGRGQSPLGGLPKRSAVIAFSTADVFQLATRLRKRKGGASVVLGALSPRARNAQVALYESGEVDYLVATDAIGMGLNLNIDHVAFAGLSKFDGQRQRPLDPAELAQIAGRAGRHLRSGSFGTLAPLPAMAPALRRQIEQHRFERVSRIFWRNGDLDLGSLQRLKDSLRAPPPSKYLLPVREATDAQALHSATEDDRVRSRCQSSDTVTMLWECCQLPDYGSGAPHLHASQVKELFLRRLGGEGRLSTSWLEAGLEELDDPAGDIDQLTAKLGRLRTWSYVCHQSGWIERPAGLRERCTEVEARLGDALHERLVERFVERRRPAAGAKGSPSPGAVSGPFAALQSVRQRLVGDEAPRGRARHWLEELLGAEVPALRLDLDGSIFSEDRRLGRLQRGPTRLQPEVVVTAALHPGDRLRLSKRLQAWSRDLVASLVGPLRRPPPVPFSGPARGLVYQLEERFGTLRNPSARALTPELTTSDRRALRAAGVKFGKLAIYLQHSLGPALRQPRVALCQVYEPQSLPLAAALVSRRSFETPREPPAAWLLGAGFIRLGAVALRVDLAEKLAAQLDALNRSGPFRLEGPAFRWLGVRPPVLEKLAVALRYARGERGLWRRRGKRRRRRRAGEAARNPAPD